MGGFAQSRAAEMVPGAVAAIVRSAVAPIANVPVGADETLRELAFHVPDTPITPFASALSAVDVVTPPPSEGASVDCVATVADHGALNEGTFRVVEVFTSSSVYVPGVASVMWSSRSEPVEDVTDFSTVPLLVLYRAVKVANPKADDVHVSNVVMLELPRTGIVVVQVPAGAIVPVGEADV